MRIISGTARGTNLYTLEGLETRPTLDRVKESVFNIISERIYDAKALDLFAGSGAIGIEFASRGASKVFLCDNSIKALEIINKNIEKTHLKSKIQTFNCDFKKCLKKIDKEKFDIIYLDPPYKTDYIKQSLEIILKLNLISDDGIVILETDESERIENEINELGIERYDKRKYGRVFVFILNF